MKKIKFQALLIAIFLFTVSLWTNAQECTNCQSSIVSGISASALGFGNQAIGNGSTVIGFESITKSQGGIAIGKHLEIPSHLHYTIAIGSGYNEDNMLINTVGPSLFVGFGSTKPTFFVGPSNGINSTGRIGIGNVTSPQAKLHIRADALEDASLLLEPSDPRQKKALLQMMDANTGIAVGKSTGLQLFTDLGLMQFSAGQFTFEGPVKVAGLEVNGAYSLPLTAGTSDQFLRADGKWAGMDLQSIS
jgi:hypothetical protein